MASVTSTISGSSFSNYTSGSVQQTSLCEVSQVRKSPAVADEDREVFTFEASPRGQTYPQTGKTNGKRSHNDSSINGKTPGDNKCEENESQVYLEKDQGTGCGDTGNDSSMSKTTPKSTADKQQNSGSSVEETNNDKSPKRKSSESKEKELPVAKWNSSRASLKITFYSLSSLLRNTRKCLKAGKYGKANQSHNLQLL